jgi:DNA polymerase III subunit epsilon
MAENPCWEGYEQIGMKKKNGKKVPNCVPIKRAKNLSTLEEQTQKIKDAGLALVKQANSEFSGTRLVTHKAAITVIERSLVKNETEPFSVRKHRAITELSQYITLAQHNRVLNGLPEHTDLLPVAHPRSTRAHDMTTASLMKFRARWVTDDPSIQDLTIKTLLASALTAHPASAEYEYSVARLESFPEGQIPAYALLAALGDGNSSAARSARAMRQRRDRKGRFAEMGGGLRALIRRINGMIQNLNGRAVAQGVDTDTFDFETPDGKLYRVPAGNVEAIKAVIPSQQTPDGYAKNPAKASAKDPVINEADLVEVEAPEGFRRDDAWSPKKEDQDYYGDNVDLGVKYTDDAYDVIKMENNQAAKDKFEMAQQRENEGQNVVAQGEGANGELDPNKPVYIVNRRGQEDDRPFAVVQSWAEVQDFIGQDEPRFEKDENPKPDRMGGGDDGGDEPPAKPDAELPEGEGEGEGNKFPKGTRFIPGTDKPSRAEMREYRKNLKDFRKNGGLLPLDPRKSWAMLPDGSVVNADTGEVLRDSERKVNLPEAEPGLMDRIKARLAPKGAYEVDRDEYKPEGAIDGQESPDFTDDPAELAQKFDQEELQESLKDAVEGTPEDPATGVGRLPFQEGDERVPAEALYNALKEQGVDVDKFLDDLYRFNQEAKAKQAPADADVAEAPVAKISDKELPPLIEGMTPEEQRDFIDNGDYKKYLPKNVEHDVPEGYVGLSNDPFNAEEAPVPADAPEGFSNDPVDIALGYDKEELKGELRRAIEPGGDMPGQGLLAQETPEGEEYVASVPGEAIRDALQLQGEDTNALIQDIYDEGKDNEPSNQEIADALEGENVQEEPAEAPQQAPQDAQGPDAAEPKAGLPADNQPQGTEGRAEVAEGVERLGSQEADLAMGEPRREMVRAADLQPGDIAVRDNEFFVIEEVATPADLSEGGQKDKGRNRIKVKGYYPGHQTQDRDWFANGKIEVIRGVAAPAKGDADPLNKPKLEDYVGGPKEMKKIDGEWGAKDPAVQEKYAADLAAHKAAVQAAGANFVDPTKKEADEGFVSNAAQADALPAAAAGGPPNGPFIVKVKAKDLQIGDISTKDHFRIVDIKAGEGDKVIIVGHYPGQGLQEKQWKPDTRIEVYRGIPEDQAPQLGEGSLHRPAGRGPKGGWFPIEDTALNAEHEAKLAEVKGRWTPPENLPIVASGDINGENNLEDNLVAPEPPKGLPPYPAFLGKFAEWAKEAQENWAAFRDKLKGQEVLVFDFETTGIGAASGNEPWQIAAVKMVDGKIVDRINIFMNPGRSLKGTYAGENAKDPDGNPLTDEFFADKPSQAEGLAQFLEWAGANPLAIAQNAKFDDEIMKRKAAELGLEWNPAGMADTMGMAAAIFKDAPGAPGKKGLGAIAEFLGIDNKNWHDGANDAEVTAQAFTKLIDLAAEGNYGVGALDADAQKAAYDAKMADVQPRIDAYNAAVAEFLGKKALRDGLAGKEVNLPELQKLVSAPLPEGPIDNVGAMDNPEEAPRPQADLVDVEIDSAFPDGKMRIAEPEFANDLANVEQLFRGDIKANDLRPGDFVKPKKDADEFFQVVSIRGGEEFGVEEFKRRVVVQNAAGDQRVMFWNQNAFLDEVRRPKDRKALAGEPLPEVVRTPEEINMQAVTVANGNAVLEITQDGDEFVAKGRILDNEGNEVYAFEGRYLTAEGAEAEAKALLRKAGQDLADMARRNEGKPESKEKSMSVGVEPANVDQLPVIEVVEDLPVGEGQNEITPRVEGDAVVFKSDAKVVDEGEVLAQVVEEFPSKKAASEGGRNNIDAMAEALADQIKAQRDELLLRTDGRGRGNLPPIPEKYRRQVFLRMLAGLYADSNGNPLAIGDKVIHERKDMADKYGEGIVVGKVQGAIGGLQRKGVVYVDYVRVQYPDGTIRKYASRFQRHVDDDVAKQRFDEEPRINWMNQDEMDIALAERRKKPRKGNEAVDAADAEVEEVVGEINDVVAPKAEAPEVPATPEPELVPEVLPEAEVPVAAGDPFEDFNDTAAIRAKLVELQQQLPKFRGRDKDKEARWLRREVDRLIGDIDNGIPIDRLGIRGEASLRNAQIHARGIRDAALRDKFMEELRKFNVGRDAKAAELLEARKQEILDVYKNGFDKNLIPADKDAVNKEDFIKLLESLRDVFPDYNKAENIDRYGHRIRDNIDSAIRNLQGMDEDKLFQLDGYLDNAIAYMRNAGFGEDEKKAIADDFEKAINVFKEKASEQKATVYKKFYDKLAEPNSVPALDKDNINKDNLLEALNKVLEALPDEAFAPSELRNAKRYLKDFADDVARYGDRFAEVGPYYFSKAIDQLRADGNVDAVKYADILENIKNVYSSPEVTERLRQERLAEFQNKLQEPFPQDVIQGGVNKQNLGNFAQALVDKLPEDNNDLDKAVARAAYYAGKFARDIRMMDDSDGGIRAVDIRNLEKVIEKLELAPDLEKNALLPIVQSVKNDLVDKKNELKGEARNRFLARRDAELPADLWPTPENESKQKFVDAVQDIFNRLPQDKDEDEDTNAIEAREYLKNYLEDLNGAVDPLTASRKRLESAISRLASSTDPKHKAFADLLQSNISDYIGQRLIERPVRPYAGINIEEVDPIALAEERVAKKENPYKAPDNIKNYFADDANYDPFLLPFKSQIQDFFNGDENAFAQMDIRARQALAQKVAQMLKNPPANRTAEDLEFSKELAKVVYGLHQERDFYQPQRENVGAAQRLMSMDPVKVLEAFKKYAGTDQEVVIDGQPSGFKAKSVGMGVNAASNFIITDIATGQKFIFKKEATKNTARAEYEAAQIAKALGIGGRVYIELHPQNSQYMVQTFAGDAVRGIGNAQVFDYAGINVKDAAARANIVDLIGMGILDAIISNTDRHEQNFMVIDADALGVDSNGYEDLYILPIDHGYANALNSGDRGGNYAPSDYYDRGAGRKGGEIQQRMAAMMGATAYKELFDMSIQQVYQALQRDGGANFDPATYKVIMSRIEALRGIDVSKWKKMIGKD